MACRAAIAAYGQVDRQTTAGYITTACAEAAGRYRQREGRDGLDRRPSDLSLQAHKSPMSIHLTFHLWPSRLELDRPQGSGGGSTPGSKIHASTTSIVATSIAAGLAPCRSVVCEFGL